MTSHVSIYMHKMAAAGVPMTTDQFAPRTRQQVMSDIKNLLTRGLVTKVGKRRTVAFTVSAAQLEAFLSRPSSIRTELLEMAAKPSGVSSDELLGRVKKAVGTVASLLTKAGLLHVWIGSKQNRWFATAAARNAYASTVQKSADRKSTRLNSSHVVTSRMPSSA